MCFSRTEFLCMQIMLLFHGRESTSHNIIKYYYFIKILLRVRSIPWYSSILSFNSRVIFSIGVVASERCMAVSSSLPFLGSVKNIKLRTGCKTESQHNLFLFKLGFFYTILLQTQAKYNQKLQKNQRKRIITYYNYRKFFRRSFLYPEQSTEFIHFQI